MRVLSKKLSFLIQKISSGFESSGSQKTLSFVTVLCYHLLRACKNMYTLLYQGGIVMFMLLMVVLVVLSVVLSVAVTVLVKGNESLKAQYRAYVTSVNSVYDNHADVIIGMQAQVEDLLTRRADDQAVIAGKDHHIAGLIAEVAARQATVEGAFDEAAAFRNKAESLHKELFEKKTELDNAMSNYKKLEAYALVRMQKSSPSIFEECSMANDAIYVMEDELNINWFK